MSLALYRRYRPETFVDVIGQDHVTEPLQQALLNDRIHHAYLLSGPRGCGKTTSARILARCLNCAEGPTPTPCGACQSCLDLARDGAGSLDVIEIDAASHGGVDDARDLRERAFYAPASSRFKIYIIDEAHMVSREGFNALLKLVEEPPEHVKFVFATTEPDKVIATIRSRTHHYPFRLVPPGELLAHLARVCEQEGVAVDRTVLSLVVRAGRGSVRDSLSVLDQLLAGAGPDGVTYQLAATLLGYTDAALLDDTVEAFAAGDGAEVFRIVDRVVEGGHDPRRFAEDLLERLRDLIIIDAVPHAAGSILGDHPPDELDRMREQAAHFGPAQLARAADIINAGLTEMRGATAPRLQLELMCARVLLPGAGAGEGDLGARLERLERRMSIPAAPSAAPEPEAPRREREAPRREPPTPEAAEPAAPAQEPAPPDTVTEPASPRPGAPGGDIDVTTVRRMWPDVLAALAPMKRTTWTFVSQNATVLDVGGNRLTLGFSTAGLRDAFTSRSDHQDYVREALIQVLGVDWKIDAIVDPSTAPGKTPTSAAPAKPQAAASTRPERTRPGRAAGSAEPTQGSISAAAEPAGPGQPSSGADEGAPSADDADADDTGLSHQDLLARELGARVISEYDHG